MPDRELARRIRALFLEELDDALEVLSTTVVTLPHLDEAATNDAVRELFRRAHSVKGAAQAAGSRRVMVAAHRLEDRFGAVRDGEAALDEALVDDLLRLVDDLAHARAAEVAADPPSAPGANSEPVAVEPPSAPIGGGRGAVPRRTRVDAAKLDVLLAQTHELVALAAQLDAAAHRGPALGAGPAALGELTRRLQRLSTELASTATSLTFLPVDAACRGLARAVHDAAAAAGKAARLEVVGGEVEADRAVLEVLRDPLLQLVGNAVAHGIEPPEVRRAAGKPEQGTITVAAEIDAGQLVVQVRDDGAGLDAAALRRAAELRGVSADDPGELAFAPGVSTADAVTETAGRGVGLDVARSGAQAVGGSVRLTSALGRGTVATITVPATLALVRCLRTDVAGVALLVPLTTIERVVRCDASALVSAAGRLSVVVEDEPVPVASLATGVGLRAAEPPADTLLLLVVDSGAGRVALAVDALHEELEVPLRPAPARLSAMAELLGVATVAGTALPVLNLVECARRARDVPAGADVPEPRPAPPTVRVLVVDDTLTTRTLVAAVLAAAGYDVLTAGDGEAAWGLLERERVDVVLTDVHMPGMDGLELCRRIRAHERLADLPVVVVSSLGTEADRRAGLEAGASAYVVKADFDRLALIELIEQIR